MLYRISVACFYATRVLYRAGCEAVDAHGDVAGSAVRSVVLLQCVLVLDSDMHKSAATIR